MPKSEPPFPEEITDDELALEVGKYAWKKVVKKSKDTTSSRVRALKVTINEHTCKHVYKFNAPPPQQLLGLFASALEIVNEKQIIRFDPKESKLIIEFSTENFVESND